MGRPGASGSLYNIFGVGVILGVFIGIMEKKMETTILCVQHYGIFYIKFLLGRLCSTTFPSWAPNEARRGLEGIALTLTM